MNTWKAACLVLATVLLAVCVRWAYWHERWHDEELYRLRVALTQVVHFLNAQGKK